jgi:hypothetical protein
MVWSFYISEDEACDHSPIEAALDAVFGFVVRTGFRNCVRTGKPRDSWWQPPHLCGGRSALALREIVSTRSCALSLVKQLAGKLALYQGPTLVGPQRLRKNWALAPAVFLTQSQINRLRKPRSSLGSTARLKRPDTKHESGGYHKNLPISADLDLLTFAEM